MSVRHAWVVSEGSTTTSWFDVRLAFADGARVDALAVLSGAHVRVEDVRARPPLSLDDLAVLAEWLEDQSPTLSCCLNSLPSEPLNSSRLVLSSW